LKKILPNPKTNRFVNNDIAFRAPKPDNPLPETAIYSPHLHSGEKLTAVVTTDNINQSGLAIISNNERNEFIQVALSQVIKRQ
jgi:hypothetical protein